MIDEITSGIMPQRTSRKERNVHLKRSSLFPRSVLASPVAHSSKSIKLSNLVSKMIHKRSAMIGST